MAEGIKISEFESINELQEACCLPTISNGQNRKITYGALRNQLINELKAAGVTAFVDITNLVTWDSYITNQSLLATVDKNLNIVTLYAAFTFVNGGGGSSKNIFSNLQYKPRDTDVNAPVWVVASDQEYYRQNFTFNVATNGTAKLTRDTYWSNWNGTFYSALSFFKAEE